MICVKYNFLGLMWLLSISYSIMIMLDVPVIDISYAKFSKEMKEIIVTDWR